MSLQINSLQYSYARGTKPARYNAQIEHGSRVGLVGANGSGKSTLIKLLTSELTLQQGDVVFNQSSLRTHSVAYKQRLGYMPDEFVTTHWRVNELLRFIAIGKQLSLKDSTRRVEQLLEQIDLKHLANKPVASLSLGERQKVNLCQALLNHPHLLICDEPLNGLDPVEQQRFWQHLRQLTDTTVLIASHHLAELDDFCSRILIIDQMTIVADLDLVKTPFSALTRHKGGGYQFTSFATETELNQSVSEASSLLFRGTTIQAIQKAFEQQANHDWQWSGHAD